jgi:ketoreductase
MTARPLSGKVALVTGAARNIGRAIALALADDGAAIVVNARSSRAEAEGVADEIRAAGGRAVAILADVTSPPEVKRLFEEAAASFGPVDVLVNNAGRSGGGVTAEIPDELWLDVIDTNLNAVFRVTREVLSAGGILGRPHGRIISIASTGGKQGVALGAPYSASKHGVVGFTKALGLELAKTGVTVNAVCPGYVETPMAARVRQGYAAHWAVTEDDVLERFEAKIPLGRYSTPDEVAGLVTYLTTPLADSITAQALNVCGGLGNY